MGRWPLPSGPRRGHSRYPVRLPSDCRWMCLLMTDSPGPTVPAWWPLAHIVRSLPARAPPLMVPLARYDRALTPRPTHHVARAALGRNPKADACVVGAGAPLHHLDTARPAGQHPGYLADLPPGLAARHLPATLRYPRHVARAIPARVRWAILVYGSRPSRTAQPPRRASMVGRELLLRKDDRGGTTTGIASGFLVRIKRDLSVKQRKLPGISEETPYPSRPYAVCMYGWQPKACGQDESCDGKRGSTAVT